MLVPAADSRHSGSSASMLSGNSHDQTLSRYQVRHSGGQSVHNIIQSAEASSTARASSFCKITVLLTFDTTNCASSMPFQANQNMMSTTSVPSKSRPATISTNSNRSPGSSGTREATRSSKKSIIEARSTEQSSRNRQNNPQARVCSTSSVYWARYPSVTAS